jgi:hypothetical protein
LPKWEVNRLALKIRDPKARADVEDNFRKTAGQLIGGAVVLIGAGFAVFQFLEQQKAAHDLLISNQVSKGFEQLASREIAMRLGGIYALENVMNDKASLQQYHGPVLEALCAFVRESAKTASNDKPPIDVQAALTVIGRRKEGPEGARVDLANISIPNANLLRANLSDADLRGALLRGADLSRAEMFSANLSGAALEGADLSGANLTANLSDANLSGAHLRGAKLSYANLSDANLSGADLSGAHLRGAKLSYANLSDANLSGADLSGAAIRRSMQRRRHKAAGRPHTTKAVSSKAGTVSAGEGTEVLPWQMHHAASPHPGAPTRSPAVTSSATPPATRSPISTHERTRPRRGRPRCSPPTRRGGLL